jgi:ribose 1,5-bisphosphokinase PhnN
MWAAARRRARDRAAQKLAEARQAAANGQPCEIPHLMLARRESSRRHYHEKVKPKRLAERAEKGDLAAKWELEHYASKEAWMQAQRQQQQAVA